MNKLVNHPRIIVALDFEDKKEAIQCLQNCDPTLCRVKVGKTMFTKYGPDWIHTLNTMGYDVFLDLKYHDIPNTVKGACKMAAELGVWMVNVHALGGASMLAAAREGIESACTPAGEKPLLIGVTILTSLKDEDLALLGLTMTTEQMVKRLAWLCDQQGLDGVVCSPNEAAMIKNTISQQFITVTPGIRTQESHHNDQQRVMTPQAAIQAGADYLVMGRSLWGSGQPTKEILVQLYKSIQELTLQTHAKQFTEVS